MQSENNPIFKYKVRDQKESKEQKQIFIKNKNFTKKINIHN